MIYTRYIRVNTIKIRHYNWLIIRRWNKRLFLPSKIPKSAICQKARPPSSPRISCPHCEQTFSKKSNLNAHLKRKHLETIEREITLYKCDKCPKQFTRSVKYVFIVGPTSDTRDTKNGPKWLWQRFIIFKSHVWICRKSQNGPMSFPF